jgi:hypothetical protein
MQAVAAALLAHPAQQEAVALVAAVLVVTSRGHKQERQVLQIPEAVAAVQAMTMAQAKMQAAAQAALASSSSSTPYPYSLS